ncbi:daf-12-interacting protein 1 isoform X2 [Cherax quadricarinatus]|uniref:daf-12-interacting protein 1 isoform X2 n=1 Tax=Cherax quadricarinatus TaxID=27406 RepID=UPI00387E7A82
MSLGGLGSTPVYVVMPSPGAGTSQGQPQGGAFLQDLLRNIPYTPNHGGVTIYELPESAQQQQQQQQQQQRHRGTDSVPMSAASWDGSRWSASSDHFRGDHPTPTATASYDDRNAGRARWGDRGVGVGHLWAPGDESSPGTRGGEVLPPAWADQSEESVLPGAPMSKPGQRTYARGGGMMKMDPEEVAERERRKKQAEETQRIIKLQLEEKKRQKAVEEEREKREAALWEERVKEQQEREAREYQEEIRKKREKEEAEERRQQQLRSAIKEASERAKKEKTASKYGHVRSLSSSGPLPEVREEGDEAASLSPRSATTPRQRHQHRRQLSQQEPIQQSSVSEHHQQLVQPEQQQQQQPQTQPQQQLQEGPQPTTQQKVSGDCEELAVLLRTLGLTPETLLASSGRGALLTLLQAVSGPRLSPLDYQADYITNRVITPTKYRGPPSRECGTQCDDSPPGSSPRRESRKRVGRRSTTSLPRESGHSSDARPPWGHNHSDRPYRKQSEKDPYSNRRLRRRAARSLSRCDQDTGTEESDQPHLHRRRRKTWDKSRQESLSSDISRSPSPRERRRRGSRGSTGSPRQWPVIKPSLTPALHQSLSPQPVKSPSSPPLLTSQEVTNIDEDDDNDVQVSTQRPASPPTLRPASPPVPALMRKLTGESTFDVPEFAPEQRLPPRSNSPPIPTVLKRLHSLDSTPTLPELPLQSSRPSSRPTSPMGLTAATCLAAGSRPVSSGPSHTLQGRINGECNVGGGSSSQPLSPSSRPPTPRRLPPITPSRSEELVASPRPTSVPRSASPPVPAVAKRLSASSRSGQSPHEPRLERQLTPVENPESPRHQPTSSPTASPPSAVTSGVSSRPGSATSGQDEDVRTVSVTSSGYESGRRSSGEPRSLSEPLVSPDKWVILKSLSSLRQNLWRRHQELSNPESDGSC